MIKDVNRRVVNWGIPGFIISNYFVAIMSFTKFGTILEKGVFAAVFTIDKNAHA